MNEKTPFVKSPASIAVVAGIVLTTAGIAFSAGSHRAVTPLPYTPSALPAVSITTEKMGGLPDLKALDNEFQRLAAYAEPAVVLIKSEGKAGYSITGEKGPMIQGEGSGVILRPDGWIVTNDHVVAGFDKVTVVLHDGREFTGTVRRAPDSDIAVVKIEAKDLPTLPFADSSKVHVGQLSMAVGAPFGLENTVTYGHISATGRLNTIPDQHSQITRHYFDLLQTDASINMGNSGGPLINVDGEVIGINSAIYSLTGSSSGIGFAISSNLARTLAETLIEKGKVVRSYAGVFPESLKEYEGKQLKLADGAILRQVKSDGPAAAAGIEKGDVVVRVGTLPINNEVDMRNSMFRYSPGTTVPFEVIREGQHKEFQVKLSEVPSEARTLNPTEDGQDLQIPDVPGVPKLPFPDKGSPDRPRSTDGKAHLGVQVQSLSETLRKQYHIPTSQQGAVVMVVEPGSIAEGLGLQPGDVIESIGDAKVRSADDVVSTMKSVKSGDQKSIGYARFGEGNAVTRARIDTRF